MRPGPTRDGADGGRPDKVGTGAARRYRARGKWFFAAEKGGGAGAPTQENQEGTPRFLTTASPASGGPGFGMTAEKMAEFALALPSPPAVAKAMAG